MILERSQSMIRSKLFNFVYANVATVWTQFCYFKQLWTQFYLHVSSILLTKFIFIGISLTVTDMDKWSISWADVIVMSSSDKCIILCRDDSVKSTKVYWSLLKQRVMSKMYYLWCAWFIGLGVIFLFWNTKLSKLVTHGLICCCTCFTCEHTYFSIVLSWFYIILM
jgi:hypothetical protein